MTDPTIAPPPDLTAQATPEVPEIVEGGTTDADNEDIPEVTETKVDTKDEDGKPAVEKPVLTDEQKKQERLLKQAALMRATKKRNAEVQRAEDRRLANELKEIKDLSTKDKLAALNRIGIDYTDLIIEQAAKDNPDLDLKKDPPTAEERVKILEEKIKKLDEADAKKLEDSRAATKAQAVTDAKKGLLDYLSDDSRKDQFPAIHESKAYDRVYDEAIKYVIENKLTPNEEEVWQICQVTAEIVEETLVEEAEAATKSAEAILRAKGKLKVEQAKEAPRQRTNGGTTLTKAIIETDQRQRMSDGRVGQIGLNGKRVPSLGDNGLRSGETSGKNDGFVMDREERWARTKQKYGVR